MPIQALDMIPRDGYTFFDRYGLQRAFFEDVRIDATVTVYYASADAQSREWLKAFCRHLLEQVEPLAATALKTALKREDDEEEDVTLPAGDDYWDFFEVEGSREKKHWRFTGLFVKKVGNGCVEIECTKDERAS